MTTATSTPPARATAIPTPTRPRLLYSQNLVVSNNVAVQGAADENNFLVLFCFEQRPGDRQLGHRHHVRRRQRRHRHLRQPGGNSGSAHHRQLGLPGWRQHRRQRHISSNDQFYNIYPGYAASTVSNNVINGWNNGIKVVNGPGGSWSGTTISRNTVSHSAIDGITVEGAATAANYVDQQRRLSRRVPAMTLCRRHHRCSVRRAPGTRGPATQGPPARPVPGLCGVVDDRSHADRRSGRRWEHGHRHRRRLQRRDLRWSSSAPPRAPASTWSRPPPSPWWRRPGTAGTVVDVIVTSPSGTSATSAADHYGYFTSAGGHP